MSKAKKPPYLKHLNGVADLVTKPEATRAGFVALALEKNRRATPHVSAGRALRTAASEAPTAPELRTIDGIRPSLLTASGISDKANNYLLDSDREAAVTGLITEYLEPVGADFVTELVYRFLLIRGDTLGGSMRNAIGAMAQHRLARALLATLSVAGVNYRWQHTDNRTWADKPEDDTGIEHNLRAISWRTQHKTRTLIFNAMLRFVGRNGNNVDVCLFNRAHTEVKADTMLSDTAACLALGELKGRFDPGGADEHWKTGDTALDRIRKATPNAAVFFIGGAIESSMAADLWEQLQSGTLSNAANLTDDAQLSSICRWLCEL